MFQTAFGKDSAGWCTSTYESRDVKTEFLIQFVLARASVVPAPGFMGGLAATEAVNAWEVIEREINKNNGDSE